MYICVYYECVVSTLTLVHAPTFIFMLTLKLALKLAFALVLELKITLALTRMSSMCGVSKAPLHCTYVQYVWYV